MALGDLADPPVFDSDEVYIRRFKEGTTRVRFLPTVGKKLKGTSIVEVYGSEAWPSELEHYARSIRYFPCVTPHGGQCGGCTDSDEQIRKRSRQWYVNVLDEDGNVRVFKMGKTLHDIFQEREARHPGGPVAQPLSKRDYLIHHIGTGLDSTYDPEADPDGLYEVDFSTVQPYDISAILENLAERARRAYSGEDDVINTPAANTTTAARTQPAAAAQPAKQRISPKTIEEKIDATLSEFTPWGKSPSKDQVEAADTATIRAWLAEQGVDYPPRANRAMLLKLVTGVVGGTDD